MEKNLLREELNRLVERYNTLDFIEKDPISIPHRFSLKKDQEIAAFFAAIFAWGNRTTIINKSNLLMNLMDDSPYEFILHHSESDLKRLMDFVHRTFNSTDLLYFIDRLRRFYVDDDGLEFAFSKYLSPEDETIEPALSGFYTSFFDVEYAPKRTRKHIASPDKKSTCKRLCMFLRWMVRKDAAGVDFGLWESIKTSQLMIPYDVHVEKMAREYGLLTRKQRDWKAVCELTANLRKLDAEDPVKYDFALFGASVNAIE